MLNLGLDSHPSELLERTGEFSAKITCEYTKINTEIMMVDGIMLCSFQYSAYLRYSWYKVWV